MDESSIKPQNHLKIQLVAAVLVAACYLAVFAVMERSGFWVVDNGLKFIQTRGIIINQYRDYSIPWRGAEMDPEFRFNPIPSPFGFVVNGRLYGTFSISFALLSSFLFRIFSYAGLYIIPLLGGMLTIYGAWRMGELLPGGSWTRILCIIITAICTPVWFYSETLWEHAPGTGLFTMGVFYSLRYLRGGVRRHVLLSALFCGLSIYFRDELYVFSAVLFCVVALRSRGKLREIALFPAAMALALVTLWLFQWRALGSPFGQHLLSISPFEAGAQEYLESRWLVLYKMLIASHESSLLSVGVALPYLALFLFYPGVSGRRSVAAAAVTGLASLVSGSIIFAGHLFSDSPLWRLDVSNGLFAASPVLLFAFVRFYSDGKSGEKGAAAPDHADGGKFLWTITLAYVFLYVALSPARKTGGIHWGCRFLLPLYPIFAVMASSAIASWLLKGPKSAGRAITTTIIAVSLALSFAEQVYSAGLLLKNKSYNARLNEIIASRPEKVIVTSGWSVAMMLANNFYDKEIYLVSSGEDVNDLAQRLERDGVKRVLEVNWQKEDHAMLRGGIFLKSELGFMNFELKPTVLR